jgi:hypothetical protein
MKIFKINQIKEVKAMPEYNLLAVDFYPFQEDVSFQHLKEKVERNLDSKNDIKQLIDEYEGLKNSVLIPDGQGNLYRWFFKNQESMLKFLEDKQFNHD